MTREDERLRRDIDDEIRVHLEARVEHLVARGMTPDAARAEALRRFGDLETGRAALYSQAATERRRKGIVQRLEAVQADLRYVARSLRRQPGFTIGVVATLGLGIGLNAAIFGVADRVLFRAPAGVDHAENVRLLETMDLVAGREPVRNSVFSYAQARAAADAGVLGRAALSSRVRMMTDASGLAVAVAYVDAQFLPMLGVRPTMGRFFDVRETEPAAEIRVAVVSFGFWQRRLAARQIAGATVTIGARSYQVIGVTSREFNGIDLDPTDVWLPLGVAELGRGMVNGVVIPWYRSDMLRALRVLGRMGPAASEAVAASRVAAALAHLPAPSGERRIALQPIVPAGGSAVTDTSRRLLARLFGVSVIVFFIACANATHLLLARGLRRQREIATRLALGASRARVWRLLMIESVLLAIAGGIAAVVAGSWAAEALRALVFPDSRWAASTIDGRSLALVFGLATAAGLMAGLAPAAQATAPDVAAVIRTGRGGSVRRTRITRGTLLTIQTGLSVVLLVASGLLVISLVRLNRVSLGFEPDDLVTVSLTSTTFPGEREPAAMSTRALAANLRQSEPAAEIAFATPAPFGATRVVDLIVPGSTFQPESPRDAPRLMEVSADYFRVMRSRTVWGRTFTDDDAAGEPVAVVNESMARNYWGAAVPPGACVLPYGSPCARVVGVVQDLRETPTGAAAPMRFYLPLEAHAEPNTLLMRSTAAQAGTLAARVRAMIPVGQRSTMEIVSQRIGRSLRPWRAATWLFVALGAVALAIACAGIYSIVSYSASERLHEMGIRVALGATRRDLLALVVGGGLRLAIAGGVAGLIVAAPGGRLLASLLFQVSPFDVRIYAAALACIVAASAGAMLPAALRASRVDAVEALREE